MSKTLKILLSLIGGASIFSISNASALTYQSSVPVQFTFNEVLSVNLSSSDLVISNLAPGSSSDSNIITVGVSTNAAFGYSLSATVGTKTGALSALVNTTNNNYSFTNLSTTAGTASTLANIPSNYWGYSYSSDNGNTWVSGDTGSAVTGYAGLPLDNNDSADERGKGGVLLINNDGSSNAVSSIQFKIGANASSSQPSGDYTNVINFYAVANPAPTYIMQEVSTWGSSLNTGDEVTAIDSRDSKTYKVAKLADGNIWMVQNLDLDLSTSTTLTPANTDISANWTPSASTYTSKSSWTDSNTTPESYNPGELYWNGNFDNDYAAWTNYYDNGGNSPLATFTSSTGDPHYHLGNYYNWTAAVAMNNSSGYTATNNDANQSICPAGWMLPKSGTILTSSKSFYYLVNTLNLTAGTNGSGNLQGSPVYLVYGGEVWTGSFGYVGTEGLYWSSVTNNGNAKYDLEFNIEDSLTPQDITGSNSGFSVRCVAR